MRTLITLLLFILAGCSSTDQRYDISHDIAPESTPSLQHIEDAQPRYEPLSLAGNKDYEVRGKHYAVLKTPTRFTEQGYASWYGEKFHGFRTSNGEVYDMYSMTAAHKTLPLPSYVRVTNQNNGKTAIVRINDRGPFHTGRIIDLSYAAAAKLEVIKEGTAPVEIELIIPEKPSTPDEWQTANPNLYFIQLAAVSNKSKASQLADELGGYFDSQVDIQAATSVYRLRLGPFLDRTQAVELRDKAKASKFPQAFIITEKRELALKKERERAITPDEGSSP